ncbi:MAG: hypothetical protein K9L68_00765 [Spirochaetales bacterium]|nr:hypothetical protein [Spirochaetales bacterium]MCF7937108.1 hypothetical protein [Spirochaetales bacterium]
MRFRFVSITACILLFVVSAVTQISAQTLNPRTLGLPDGRIAAIGGPQAALTDDFRTLSTNPAGLVGLEEKFILSRTGFHFAGPIFDIANIALESSASGAQDLLTSPQVQDLLKGNYTAFDLSGPIYFGYVNDGIGFSITQNTGFVLNSRTSTSVQAAFREYLQFTGGYAYRFPLSDTGKHNLDLGIALKAFFQGESYKTQSLLEVYKLFENPAGSVFGSPFDLTVGFGVDLGLVYSPITPLAFGFTARNLLAPISVSSYTDLQEFIGNSGTPSQSSDYIPPNFSFGVRWSPRVPAIETVIERMSFFLNYEDIIDFWTHSATSTNPVLHLGLGTELTMLEILSLRAGLYQGLFAAGFGIEFPVVEIDAAMYGRELSPEPGMRPVYNFTFGATFSL